MTDELFWSGPRIKCEACNGRGLREAGPTWKECPACHGAGTPPNSGLSKKERSRIRHWVLEVFPDAAADAADWRTAGVLIMNLKEGKMMAVMPSGSRGADTEGQS
jgi:RecJ-like exonuclease